MAIQQINIGYSAPEDRLLLKIGMSNNIEINVWLTRNVVKTLWQLLQETSLVTGADDAHTLQTQESTQGFASERTAHQLDFSEEYKKRASANSKELLLAQECRVVKIGHELPALELICTNGQTIKVALNPDLTLALINMLQMVTKEAAWDLAFSEQPSLLSPVTTNTVLH